MSFIDSYKRKFQWMIFNSCPVSFWLISVLLLGVLSATSHPAGYVCWDTLIKSAMSMAEDFLQNCLLHQVYKVSFRSDHYRPSNIILINLKLEGRGLSTQPYTQ